MLTRRSFALSGTAVAAASASILGAAPRSWAQGGDAAAFIQDLGGQFVRIVNGPGSVVQKRAEMQPLVESAVDVDGIARFCLGRFWSRATPQQQAEYVRLFHYVVLNSITARLGEFRGIGLDVTGQRQAGGVSYVNSTIRRPNQEPASVQWVVSPVAGRLKIVDVIVVGTSLRITQRDEYSSYLARNGYNVNALIAAMRRQVGA